MSRKRKRPATPTVRCAIYTRKSTEEGLEQEFNSLDAQREAGEAYIKSQQHEGWVCLPDHYDDGGFTGGNMDRPALRRLLADIEAGKIDCVVVYKVDRLSRSRSGLRQDHGDVRAAQRVVRLRDAAVQHGHVDGPAGAQRAAVVRPVRTRDDLRAHPRQDRGHAPQGQVVRRHADLGLQRRGHEAGRRSRRRPNRSARSSSCTSSTSRCWTSAEGTEPPRLADQAVDDAKRERPSAAGRSTRRTCTTC